ncbi:MAG: arsenate reductase family protein [Spirochaetales bacterium]|nr:arsenate reductase family protein [Spirochaetales bacterium]
MQIFGTKKCKDTQKAERFLRERGLAFHFVDLSQKAPSAGELKSMAQSCGAENLIDRESQAFKKAQLEYMDFDAIEEIGENPLLLKTPIIRKGGKALLGFEPKALKDFLAQ